MSNSKFRKSIANVIPAQAGIQWERDRLGPRLRGDGTSIRHPDLVITFVLGYFVIRHCPADYAL
jgi:hypothetical protein